ncbi:hypothetical protein L5515_010127 [Caenorhabditis briggsae]|uniref:Uncharacterized protein n=1 Tax=Caenorhabditis briggsae TaxID=6238 RepID=A0AAE9JDQ5_CAEBR|nr:hypothetical protein L5515_010127 [Caenorhabditis briggsae]
MSDAKTNVANVVTSIKDCADVGMYTFSKMSPQLAAFVGVGLFVKNLIVSTADDPNGEVLKKLRDVRTEIKRLDDSMKKNFNDLKAFIVAQNFYNNIAVKAAILCQFWSDITVTNDEKSRESSVLFFREMYDKHSPVELSETLLQLLNNEMTNFLKSAMTADSLMTKEAFTTHRDIIGGVFAQFWMLESIASGLFHDGRTYRADKIAENFQWFEKCAKKWEEEYTAGDDFWPDKVRQFVEGIQDNNEEKTSEEKAQMIKEGLDKMMTNDLFYIVVCRSAYRCLLAADPADQTIESLDRKASNVYIFRSKKGRTASDEEMKKFSEDMKKKFENVYRHRWEQNNRNAEWMLHSQVQKWRGEMENCAFMLTVRSKEYVAVRSTHTDIRERGPGDWMDGQYHAGNIFSAGETFRVVVGFQ